MLVVEKIVCSSFEGIVAVRKDSEISFGTVGELCFVEPHPVRAHSWYGVFNQDVFQPILAVNKTTLGIGLYQDTVNESTYVLKAIFTQLTELLAFDSNVNKQLSKSCPGDYLLNS